MTESFGEIGSSTESLGSLVTAKGTADGLVLRLDGRAADSMLFDAIGDYLDKRSNFLSGNTVIIEWIAQEKSEEILNKIKEQLKNNFKIDVKASRLKAKNIPSQSKVEEVAQTKRSLFDGVETVGFSANEVKVQTNSANEFKKMLLDEPDTRMVQGTLRSGQRIETDYSLVIVGDVNSGAEVVAGGNIVVLGNLRGVAHAGAYDETGAGAFIFALNLQPTQLRIGSLISRGSTEARQFPEVAKVDGDFISVEPFSQRKQFLKTG